MSQVKNNPKIPIEIEIKKDNNNNVQRVIKTNQYNMIVSEELKTSFSKKFKLNVIYLKGTTASTASSF